VWKEYKKSRQNANTVISSTKEKKQKECASDLSDSELENEIFKSRKTVVVVVVFEILKDYHKLHL